MTAQQYRQLLGRDDMSDEQIAELLTGLDVLIDSVLDEMFREEFEPGDV